ncbi:hypothetical protein HK097_005998 [Rhizophlyctis rosea]|uniref:Uncharacterized protein n=1 Tax=Rhizophlyctis rosea TaxID=64517 RepID=A0AAD5SG88_9FUNG|nr:hypothetical protein HK097_005998 [Rhizophlyctis rosea]
MFSSTGLSLELDLSPSPTGSEDSMNNPVDSALLPRLPQPKFMKLSNVLIANILKRQSRYRMERFSPSSTNMKVPDLFKLLREISNRGAKAYQHCRDGEVGHFNKHIEDRPPGFPHLIAEEWEVVPHQSNHGLGDLVFTDDDFSTYMVVEVKNLNLHSGKTLRTSRRKARRMVEEQSERYTRAWSMIHPEQRTYGCTYVKQGMFALKWQNMIGPFLNGKKVEQ